MLVDKPTSHCHRHPTDARVKCLTLSQVQSLAALHGRVLKPHRVLPSGSGTSPSEADLHQQLASLASPGRAAAPAAGSPHLCAARAARRPLTSPPASLAALRPPTASPLPGSPALPPAGVLSSQRPDLVPIQRRARRRPLLPLIEYGAAGSYVVICPQQGELHLHPNSPRVVCLARFFGVIFPFCGRVRALHGLPRL